jgi:hypothetical protein
MEVPRKLSSRSLSWQPKAFILLCNALAFRSETGKTITSKSPTLSATIKIASQIRGISFAILYQYRQNPVMVFVAF